MTLLLKKNYLTFISNSLGTKLFKNFFVMEKGEEIDIAKDGHLSCAIFVSNILYMCSGLGKLINSPHATVSSTIKDMKINGWQKVKDPKIGAILEWEKSDFGESGSHPHIGFYMGNNLAISNSSDLGYPIEHEYTFQNTRKVLNIFWNDKLN